MPSEKVPTRFPATSLRPDHVEDLRHAATGDAVAVGQPLQVVGGAAAADDGLGVQQRPYRSERVGQLAIGLAVDP